MRFAAILSRRTRTARMSNGRRKPVAALALPVAAALALPLLPAVGGQPVLPSAQAQGLSSKQIADQLFISYHTVSTHRQNISQKTGSHNAVEALQYARAQGLI